MTQQTQRPPNGYNTSKNWLDDSGMVITDPMNMMDGDEFLTPEEIAKIWARRARELAKIPPISVSGQTKNLLVLQIKNEQYGLEVAYIREIFPMRQLTPVPRTPNFVAGIFSARGRILSVIDLRAFLGLPSSSQTDKNSTAEQAKIVVVSNNGSNEGIAQPGTTSIEVGILADDVLDMVTIFQQDIEPPLTTHDSLLAKYQQGIAPGLIVVLNLDSLLNDKRLIVYQELI